MTDSGRPQKPKLCFLSTLLSQKVPEKSNAVLRCMIAGQPKPEVTWYKNGQAIDECGIVSSYEFLENQYIHLLHLSCCTRSDAAVYQVSAKSCLGMICCSASLEVKSSSENPQCSPDLRHGTVMGWKCETETYEEEHPCKEEEEHASWGDPPPPDSSPRKFSPICSPQVLANHDIIAPSSENPLDVKGTIPKAEAYDPNNTEESFLNSNNIPDKHNVCCYRTVCPTASPLVDGGLSDDGPREEAIASSHENPKAQKYISFSVPLSEAIACIYPGDSASVNKHQVSSEDSDSDYELCPEITLTYMEEFSDDDLEYLECSDVMTDYSNAIWQQSLQGTEHVFLLESHDEEMEFSECDLGGCEHFLREMGCGPQVSGDMRPMAAITAVCGYHSQPQEVGVRDRVSRHSPSSLQTGMTLTLGPHQDGMGTVTGQGSCPLPTASEAAEDDCPGIPGETRDRHQAGEEFPSDNLLTMDKAATEAEVKPLSGGSDKSGMRQGSESLAEKRPEEKHAVLRRGPQRPTRVWWSAMKGNTKKLTHKESAPDGIFNPLLKEPKQHPLNRSHQRETLPTKAGAPCRNSHSHAQPCAISSSAERDMETVPLPADSLSKERDTSFEGEVMQVNGLFDTHQIPDQSAHLQVQIQDSSSSSQMPAFSESAGKESPFTGTTRESFSNSGGIHEENTSLTQHLELENYTQDPQQAEKQDREGNTPARSWADLEHELSTPEAADESMSLAVPSVHLPQDASTDCREPKDLFVTSPEPTDTAFTLENVFSGPRGREEVCMMECFETADQGTCYDTMDSSVGASLDKYLPEEICFTDFERTEGQSKVCDLCSPDDKTLAALPQTQGSEPAQATCKHNKDRNLAMFPLFLSAFTWNVSQEDSEGTTGEHLTEVENAPSVLSPTALAGQKRLSLLDSGEPGGTQPHSSNNSFVHLNGGIDKSPQISAPVATDTPASHSSVMKFPQDKSTALTANVKCLQVTGASEALSIIAVATKAHLAKYHTVSVSENNHADDTEENPSEAPNENLFQFPSNVQSGHKLNGSALESVEELLCSSPNVLGIPGHGHSLPEGEGFCSNCPLHTEGQSTDESQTRDRADNGSPEEDFQEKGSETKQRIQSEIPHYHGSFSAHDFQESLSPSSPAKEEANLGLSEPSPGSSREERGHSSGLEASVSMVAQATVEEDSQVPSNVPSLSEMLLGESDDTVLGNKVKAVTLEDSASEILPPRQVTDLEYKEAAGPVVSDRAWALSDTLKSDAAVPDLEPSGTASWAHSPQAEMASALDNDREIGKGDTAASNAHWNSPWSQGLSQYRFPESSVDPVEEKELYVTDSLSEASKIGGKEKVKDLSQDQEGNQLKVGHPAFLNQLLTFSNILESSVDPIDEPGKMEPPQAENTGPADPTSGAIRKQNKSTDGNLGQRVEVQPAILQISSPYNRGETIPNKDRINQDQADSEREEAKQRQPKKAKVEIQPVIWQVSGPNEVKQRIPRACSTGQVQDGSDKSLGEAEQSKKDRAEFISPTSPLSSCPAIMTHTPVEINTHCLVGQIHSGSVNDFIEHKTHQNISCNSEERGTIESECGKHVSSLSVLMQLPSTPSPKGNVTHFSISHSTEELKVKEPQIGETKLPSPSTSPGMTLAFISREYESEKAPELLQDPDQKGSTLGSGKKSREKASHVANQTGKLPGARSAWAGSEEVKKKQELSGSGHLAEGVKKKILSRVAALRLRLEEKENARKNLSLKKIPKLEKSLSCTNEKKDPKKAPCKREGKAPILLKKIRAERFPDHSGNVKLSCQFAEIHEDSTIWWTKDSKSIAQFQRSAGDNSSVSLAIVQAGQKDQGLYYCCIKNSYGKVTAEFNLTAQVLKQLAGHPDSKGMLCSKYGQTLCQDLCC
ncbi:alpha-protein kinase 2 isoform X3 [Castor canadensis]|uniref:Alpha-protein kinase 2 isoform X3 n=1 Tax=Castor canadensis TaxID=51338 RepID=A0AC58M8V8_CASCN